MGSTENLSREIKAALKKEFPNTKFSVTFKSSYGYTVKWSSDIADGVTQDNVKAIAENWNTLENVSQDTYVYSDYQGNSVKYKMKVTNPEWKGFVTKNVEANYGDCRYDQETDCFYYVSSGKRHHHANDLYWDWSLNGVKVNFDDDDAQWQKECYYQSQQNVEAKTPTKKVNLLKRFYKHHVQNLIDCDRINEIVPYSEWQEQNGDEILRKEYVNHVTTCLGSGELEEIKNFVDWLVIMM